MNRKIPLFVFVSLVLGATPPAADDDLLLHWRFDSPFSYGYVEPDASGRSHDGLLVWGRIRGEGGGEYVPGAGVFGGAGTVRGRGSLFSMEPFTLPGEWTLSFWAKPADQIGRTDTLITFTDPSRETARFNLGNRGGQFSFSTDLDGRKDGGRFDTGDAYSLDAWHHMVLVYGKDKVAFHLNGRKYESSHKLPWKPEARICLRLGGSRGGAHNRFTGLYDDVRVYGRVLDDAQIRDMADAKSEFYGKEALPPVAHAGIGYTAWLEETKRASFEGGRTATIDLAGGTRFPGQNGGEIRYRWEVVSRPAGANAELEDPARPDTRLFVDRAGAYRLRLTARNAAGSDSALVHAAVFVKDRGPGRPARLFQREPWSLLGVDKFEPERQERVDACKGLLAPVAHWSFDETGGTAARGTGPRGKAITLNEAFAFDPGGRFGGALRLTPQNDKHAVIDFGPFPELKEECTVSFWVRSDREDKRASLFHVAGENGENYWSLSNQDNKGDLPRGYSLLHFGGISSPIHLGQRWNHVVASYAPKGDFRKLYINGHLVACRKSSPLEKKAGGAPRLMFNSPGSRTFRGLLDDVAVYDRMLNNEEVWKIFQEGAASLRQRLPGDPYKTGAYRREFVEKWFPELEPKYVTGKGFAEERFDGGRIPAYEHPRLFFSLKDLPGIRGKCDARAGNRVVSQLRQYAEVGNTLDADGRFRREFTMTRAGTMLAEAYVTLLEADTDRARRVIDWMMACAAWQKQKIAGQKNLADWQHSGHDIMLRYGTPMLYDMMYPWMTGAERGTVRDLIATCTQDRWSIGMYGLPAWDAHVSNWEPWITGELMLALQSIYDEDGFDPSAYEAASRATQLCALLMADEASGASVEGMAKNNMQLEMVALVSRTQPRGKKLIGSLMPYHHVARFLFHHMAPWGGEMMKDDALGNMSGNLEGISVNVMHYAYPDDPIINYMKHNTEGRREGYSSLYLNTFGQDSPPMTWSFVQEWKGPEGLAEHLKQAVEEAGEPLGYFSNYRGLMISRSDWSPGALQLYFQPRSLQGGHPVPARGYFRINALGRVWVPFDGGFQFQESKFHSVVTVDGEGQDVTPGRVLSYEGAARTKGAWVDMMGGDLTGAYRKSGGNYYRTHNETRLYPDRERPWMDLEKRFLVHWWEVDKPGRNPSMPAEDWEPDQAFDYAYRTAALVRGAHPYVLVIDDIKKDDQRREYNWSVILPRDIFAARSYGLTDRSATLTDPSDPTRHLLVLPVSCRGEARFDVTELHAAWRDKKGSLPKLNFRCQSAAPEFRMLLYPYRDGDPLPEIAGTGGAFTVTLGGQKDVLQVEATPGGISRVKISRVKP